MPYLTGSVFLDGSVLFPELKLYARGGAAVVQMNGNRVVGCVRVAFPYLFHEPERCELFALLICIRMALPPLTIYTDCQNVINVWEACEAIATSFLCRNCDMWRLIWQAIRDHGIDQSQFTLVKVKAHLLERRVRELGFNRELWIGNRVADVGAKFAAAMHPSVQSCVDKVKSFRHVQKELCLWIGRVTHLANRDETRDAVLPVRSSNGVDEACTRGKKRLPDDAHIWRLSAGAKEILLPKLRVQDYKP